MTYAALDFQVPCACRQWVWREICAATTAGLVLHERNCPRCRRKMLIVFRVLVVPRLAVESVGVVPLFGRDVKGLADSVRALQLPPAETSILIEVAKLMAKAN